MRQAIADAIEQNAANLGEKVTIGVHYLRDGRVRIYDLSTGWRTMPYREYRSLERAYEASLAAVERSAKVKGMVAEGMPVDTAVRTVAVS